MRRRIVFFVALAWVVTSVRLVAAQQAATTAGDAAVPAAGAPAPVSTSGAPAAEQKIFEIKQTERDATRYSMELKGIDVVDFFRVVAHDYNLNILMDQGVRGSITASLTDITLEDALEEIARLNSLMIEKRKNMLVVKPDVITEVFRLSHVEAKTVLGLEDPAADAAVPGAESVSGNDPALRAGTIYDFLSDSGKVFLGAAPNSIMVVDHPANVAKVREYLDMVDRGMESRVFRLNYIRAKDLMGAGRATAAATPAQEVPADAPPPQ